VIVVLAHRAVVRQNSIRLTTVEELKFMAPQATVREGSEDEETGQEADGASFPRFLHLDGKRPGGQWVELRVWA